MLHVPASNLQIQHLIIADLQHSVNFLLEDHTVCLVPGRVCCIYPATPREEGADFLDGFKAASSSLSFTSPDFYAVDLISV